MVTTKRGQRMPEADQTRYTVSSYLLKRLSDAGVGHIFGVPGDYVLDFLDEVVASPLKWVGTCNELNAGYAADGYARMKGIGAAVVTYDVGGLSIINAVAGSFAEQVPVIVISGAPPTTRRSSGALVHHLVGSYSDQFEIFRRITADAAVLLDPETAPDEIDRVLTACIARKLPGYIEIPLDMVRRPCRPPAPLKAAKLESSDPAALTDCVAEAARIINGARSPVVLAGVELLRFCLEKEVLNLVERCELPFATTMSSKCVLPELHPQYAGLYQGGLSHADVKAQVESADCVISLGVRNTDIDTGMFSMKLDRASLIAAEGGRVVANGRLFINVHLCDFIPALTNAVRPRSIVDSHPNKPLQPKAVFAPVDNAPLTASRAYERINLFLNDAMVLIAEPGDAFCAASEFQIDEAENFVVQVYYASIGYATPAALGVSLACPAKRPVVLAGDGAFQMTAQELSTLIRNRCPAIVFIINNDGYLVERLLHTDGPYNDIQPWSYHLLPAVFGGNAEGVLVTSEGELERALERASKENDKVWLIELRVGRGDCSGSLARLCEAVKRTAKG